jgi:glycerophosphoryl diester phosphodiesterase
VTNGFPDRSFLVHIKSNDPREGLELAHSLRSLLISQQEKLMVYGADKPVATFHRELPGIRSMSRGRETTCLLRYMAIGELGLIPSACRNTMLLLPADVAPWLWGWPTRFVNRMASVGTQVFVVEDLAPGGSKGLNSEKDLSKLPPNYAGGIWTDRVEVIAPLLLSSRISSE